MQEALQQLYPQFSIAQIETIVARGGMPCPRCDQWLHLEALFDDGGPICAGCQSQVQLADGDATQVVDPPQPRVNIQPVGRPEDATLPTPPSPGDGRPPGRIGRYVLSHIVGSGGMGVVWRGFDPLLQREVAVKILHASRDHEARERFKREARIAASLEHPSIVKTLDVGEEEDELFIVQQFVKGISLAARLETWNATPTEAVELILPLVQGMAYAHETGVFHRDLKPGNVMIHEESGAPRITDFGLARREDEASNLSVTGQILGTPRYMAPEMLEDHSNLTAAADIYGLGTILYELLTGQAPIEGDTLQQILFKVSQGDIAVPRSLSREIPPQAEAICMKCLALAPEDRYASASVLAEDLRRMLANQTISLLKPRLSVAGLAGAQLGTTRLIRELCTTSYGALYEGKSQGLGPTLALVLRPHRDYRQSSEELEQEVRRIQQSPGHPNLLPIQKLEQTPEGYSLLISPYLEVSSLAQILGENGALEQELAVEIQFQLLSALEHVHDQGILHTQLATSSILITEGQRGSYVKLIEAGLTSRRSCLPDAPSTESRIPPATPSVRDATQPEALAASADMDIDEDAIAGSTDEQTPSVNDDLTAAGSVLFLMLTGLEPSSQSDPERLSLSQARQGYPFHHRLERILRLVLDSPSAPRYSAASAFATALPRFNKPSVVWRALRITPLCLVALYLCFGMLVVLEPSGRRAIRPNPDHQNLRSGERVVARGALQWGLSRTYTPPPMPAVLSPPTPEPPNLTKFQDYCRKRGQAQRHRLLREAPAMVWIPQHSGSGFYIDKTEVTRQDFGHFLADLARAFPGSLTPRPRGWKAPSSSKERGLPVIGCSWNEARLFAMWSGKSLPTNAQWTAAATAIKPETKQRVRTFPWGPTHEAGLAHHWVAGSSLPDTPVAANDTRYTQTPYGLIHMAGNVWEWVDDRHLLAPDHRIIRGGGFASPPAELRNAHTDAFRPELSRPDLGFRCALTPEPR